MASSYTANYGLNQWEASDQVLRAEFNEDNARVDAALAGLAEQVAGKAAQSEVNTLTDAVNAKASQADLTSLTNTVNAKANQSELNALTNTVNTKASQADLTSLSNTVKTKANQSELNTLTNTVNTKASQTDLDTLSNLVAKKGNLQVETGSYVGTGTGGSSDKNSLTFSARPLLVVIAGGGYLGIFSGQMESGSSTPIGLSNNCAYSWSGNTMSWYHGNGLSSFQLNASGITYYYMAIFSKG